MAGKEFEANRNAINHFLNYLKDSSIPEIVVNDKENPALFPLYEHVRTSFVPHWMGVLIVDKQGVYTPIEKYDDNVIHLMRLPKLNVPVYALTDLRSVVYTICESLTVVFQGVFKTVNGMYDFISREYYIRPVPGISFEKHLLVQHVIKRGKYEVAVIENSSDDEDDGLD